MSYSSWATWALSVGEVIPDATSSVACTEVTVEAPELSCRRRVVVGGGMAGEEAPAAAAESRAPEQSAPTYSASLAPSGCELKTTSTVERAQTSPGV